MYQLLKIINKILVLLNFGKEATNFHLKIILIYNFLEKEYQLLKNCQFTMFNNKFVILSFLKKVFKMF
jgi:hypothetical protein